MAEYVMKELVEQEGIADRFVIASAATSTEEIWNGVGNEVYPPAKAELRRHGINCDGKRAILLRKEDYQNYDYLIGMEYRNIKNMQRIMGEDKEAKMSKLLDYTERPGDIADPWYTGEFGLTYRQVKEGCIGLLAWIKEKNQQ